ncbi:MAG: FAD-dependent oxidoreductase [Chitinophagaceae bacterium]|nr:FAD-dependent oxidoreductase [Anaerolineae bacterium]
MSSKKTHIIIIGAGYAGMIAAMRLAGKTGKHRVEITLVNPSELFVERIRLHQVAAGQTLRQRSIPHLLRGTGIKFVQGFAGMINTTERRVSVNTAENTQQIAYDYLVYTAGSMIDTDSIPGIHEYAYTLGLNNTKSAHALRDQLPNIAAQHGRLVIVGGGLTGIEAATELAEAYPDLRVSLVTSGGFGAELSQKGRTHLRNVFAKMKIEVVDNVQVKRMESNSLMRQNGAALSFDLCLWTAGLAIPTLAREAGLAVNERGQALIDPFMRSISHPEIYAAGDAAYPVQVPGAPIRMACATAEPMAAHAVDNLVAQLKDQAQKPFSYAYAFRCISLGRHNGLIQSVAHDDTPRERIFTGFVAAQFKETICRFAFNAIRIERHLPGIYTWLGRSKANQAGAVIKEAHGTI